jgi:hypothetical protein
MRKIFYFLFVIGLFCHTGLIAGEIELTQKLDKASLNGGSIKVKDPFGKSFYSELNYSTKVALIYGHEEKKDLLSTSFSIGVSYTLSFYDEADNVVLTTTERTLTI